MYFVEESNRSCYFGWKVVGLICFCFFVNMRRIWDGVCVFCWCLGGDLVLLKMFEFFSIILMELFMFLINVEIDFYVGFF